MPGVTAGPSAESPTAPPPSFHTPLPSARGYFSGHPPAPFPSVPQPQLTRISSFCKCCTLSHSFFMSSSLSSSFCFMDTVWGCWGELAQGGRISWLSTAGDGAGGGSLSPGARDRAGVSHPGERTRPVSRSRCTWERLPATQTHNLEPGLRRAAGCSRWPGHPHPDSGSCWCRSAPLPPPPGLAGSSACGSLPPGC